MDTVTIRSEQTIEAPAAAVWVVLADPGALPTYDPRIAGAEPETGTAWWRLRLRGGGTRYLRPGPARHGAMWSIRERGAGPREAWETLTRYRLSRLGGGCARVAATTWFRPLASDTPAGPLLEHTRARLAARQEDALLGLRHHVETGEPLDPEVLAFARLRVAALGATAVRLGLHGPCGVAPSRRAA